MDQTAAADAFEIGLRDHGVFLSAMKWREIRKWFGTKNEMVSFLHFPPYAKNEKQLTSALDDNDEHHHRQSLTDPKYCRK